MDSSSKNSIEQELKVLLLELDSNKILSIEEKNELKDHFLCEIDNLVALGLRDQEALLVAKKRFGILEDVNKEYQKVSSTLDWMRYGIIAVVAYSFIKILTILVNCTSEAFWIVYYQIDPRFVESYIVFDIPFKFVLIFIVGFIASKIINTMDFKNLISLWKFPVLYLIAELFRRVFTFIVLPISGFNDDLYMTMQFFSSSSYVSNISLVLFLIVASVKMYRMKMLEMEYE